MPSHSTLPSPNDPLTSLFLACDELLQQGASLPPLPADGSDTPSGDLGRDLNCLQRLYEHFAQGIRPKPDQATESELQLRPDGTLERLGRFHLQEVLGRGGFGIVYRAHDPDLGREVALKVPHWDRLTSPESQVRFRLEALAAARLDHPHVVKVHEAGTYGSVCYLATELCSPLTFADWLRAAKEPLPWREAAQLLRTLAEAVQHAHSRGVLHRDLKPGNILLAISDQPSAVSQTNAAAEKLKAESCWLTAIPKITDFGLAKILEDQGSDPTRTGTVLGSPNYMAPEQAAGKVKEIGVATDIHALGVIAYELFTGKPPYTAETPMEILQRVQSMEPVPPRATRPALPRDLETICLKCLRKQPSQRYASAADLAEDLRRWLAGEPIQARPVGLAERSVLWVRRHPWQMALVSLLFIALAVVTWFWWVAETERETADKERKTAIAERKRVEEIAQIPIQAMGDLTERLVYTEQFAGQHMAEARRIVLAAILPHFDRYLEHAILHDWSKMAVAKTQYHLAQNHSVLRNQEVAARQLEQARQLAEELVRQDPDSRDKCHLLGLIYFERGEYQGSQPLLAVQEFQRALDLVTKAGDRGMMGRCHFRIALALTGPYGNDGSRAERQQAVDHLNQAWKLFQEQTASENAPAPGPYPCTVLDHQSMLVTGRLLLYLPGDRALKATLSETLLAAAEACRRRYPRASWAWEGWGFCVHDAHFAFVRLHQQKRAQQVAEEGFRVLQEARADAQQGWPRYLRLEIRHIQGRIAHRIAETFFEITPLNPTEGARWSERVIELLDPLAILEPEDSWCRVMLATAHRRLAEFQRVHDDPARWDHYRHMRRHLEASLKHELNTSAEKQYATNFCMDYIKDLIKHGRNAEAVQVLEEMIARMEQIVLLEEMVARMVQIMEQLLMEKPGKAVDLPLAKYRTKLSELRPTPKSP